MNVRKEVLQEMRRELLEKDNEIESLGLRVADIRWQLDCDNPRGVTEDDMRRAVDKMNHTAKAAAALRLRIFDEESTYNE